MKSGKCLILCFCTVILLSATGCNSSHTGNILNSENSNFSVKSSLNSKLDSSKQILSSESSNENGQLEDFFDVKMLTSTAGYAMTKNFQLLKTTDAGVNWVKLSVISNLSANSGQSAFFVLNDEIMYVASDTASGITVKKSTDTGKNWSESLIKMQTGNPGSGYGGSLSLSFINQSDGFLLTSGLPAAGLMSKALYRTSDGGNSWNYVGSSEKSDQESGSLKGINGYTTGMVFFNKNIGYITSSYHGQNEISVYKTIDSGKKWSVVKLPLPQEYQALPYGKDAYADAYPPSIYGKDREHAKMQLCFCHNSEQLAYFYSSDNGGTTWHIDGKSNILMKKYCFVDDRTGFGLDENEKFRTTHDGGLTWLGIS